MDTGYVFPLAVIVGLIVFLQIIGVLDSATSGWSTIARRYPVPNDVLNPHATRITRLQLRSISPRGGSFVRLESTERGLVVHLAPPTSYIFWVGHGPWFIPWSAITPAPHQGARRGNVSFQVFALSGIPFPIFLEEDDVQSIREVQKGG
jgi:hypothetical protein